MGVYVDDIRLVVKNRYWPYAKACHLVADTIRELHIFARRLSLRRDWFQTNNIPHYDLTENKRDQALRFGALEITNKRMVEMIREHRESLSATTKRQILKEHGIEYSD